LRIKAFYGTSENAVKTQIWIAVCSYVLVAIVRRRLQSPQNLHTMLQVLSTSLFEKMPIKVALSTNIAPILGDDDGNQLQLFEF
jgi:hypothetical protein